MTLRKKLAIALAVFAAVAAIVGLTTVVASTSYGTQSDPLVTLSYIEQTLTPALKAEIASAVSNSEKTLTANLDSKVSEFETDISSMVSDSSSAANTFTLVSLSNGQVLSCGVGTEIMLRIGSAVSNGASSPRLVNETDSSSVTAAGTALVKNNLYMVTIQKNGIKATANGTKVLVRGSYTIE